MNTPILLQRKTEWLTLKVPAELKAQLEAYAEAHDISASSVVRIALADFLSSDYQKKQGKSQK